MLTRVMKSLWNDESGMAAVEYGIILALIGASAIAGFEALGDSLSGFMDGTSAKIRAITPVEGD